MERKTNKTVGIVTINDYTNYGNRLQNYALTTLFRNYGFEVVNGIEVYTKEDWINKTESFTKKLVKKIIPFSLVKTKIDCSNNCINNLLNRREINFKRFNESYTKTINPIVARKNKDVVKQFEQMEINFFVVGSDQVWNPYFGGYSYEFLTFAPKEKRFSFAASIGTDQIPENQKPYFKKYLSEMNYISVRENKAAEIVKDLTGRDVDVVLDPTLLLPKEQWIEIVSKPNIEIDENYICTYFLGEIPEAVYSFAKKKNLKIYKLNSIEQKELYDINPAEFLYMIKNADYVLTDSFHAVVFSIIFNKDFYVFERKQAGVANMFSRIETITQRFDLQSRIQSREVIKEEKTITNWLEIERDLQNERKQTFNKLLDAMGI